MWSMWSLCCGDCFLLLSFWSWCVSTYPKCFLSHSLHAYNICYHTTLIGSDFPFVYILCGQIDVKIQSLPIISRLYCLLWFNIMSSNTLAIQQFDLSSGTGHETFFYSNLQTFASGFNLNSQIALSSSQLVFHTFEQFLTLPLCMAIVSWRWNLVNPSPLLWQRTRRNKVEIWQKSLGPTILPRPPPVARDVSQWSVRNP